MVKYFKPEFEDLVIKSNAKFNSQIKHLQEQLRPKDDIINQTLALLSNITNIEVQSKSNIVNKLIDASIASNRNSGTTDNNLALSTSFSYKRKARRITLEIKLLWGRP